MSIVIDKKSCNGCGKCKDICPGNLLSADADGKADIRFPDECWSCAACVKVCGREAISLYLSPAAGGCGTRLKVRREGLLMRWRFLMPNGEEQVITVNSADANRY